MASIDTARALHLGAAILRTQGSDLDVGERALAEISLELASLTEMLILSWEDVSGEGSQPAETAAASLHVGERPT